jgi:hypothetical protein
MNNGPPAGEQAVRMPPQRTEESGFDALWLALQKDAILRARFWIVARILRVLILAHWISILPSFTRL